MSATPKFSTKAEYLAHLKGLRSRASLYTAVTCAAIIGGASGLDAMIQSVESDGYDANCEGYRELVKRSRQGDIGATAEVTKIRLTRIQNYYVAKSNWLMFFEVQTLADNEIPYFQNESRGETRAAVSSQDGKPRKSDILKYQDQVQVRLFMLASELYEYMKWDMYRGNVADEIKALIDIAGDLEEKVNQKAKPFVTGAIGNFVTTGAKQSRTFTLHSAIDTGNIPTTNDLDLDGDGRFSKAVMDGIIAYCASWANLFGAPLRPSSILIPSKDTTGWLADVTLTSQSNPMTDQIWGGGKIENYAGYSFPLIPDLTLSPTEGYAYVSLGRPVGIMYHKPGGDLMYEQDSKDGPLGNTGEMGARKCIGFAQPEQWSPFVLRVKYK